VRDQATTVLVLLLFVEKVARIFKAIAGRSNVQSKEPQITCDTQLKRALIVLQIQVGRNTDKVSALLLASC